VHCDGIRVGTLLAYDAIMAEDQPALHASRAYVPNYSFADAARYIRMPASTVRYWAKGGTVTTPDGMRPGFVRRPRAFEEPRR
jgi:hypothetical protein